MNIGICDDDKVIVERVGNIVTTYFDEKKLSCSIYKFYSGEEVLDSDISIDLLFLDIDMGEITGMQVAESIQKKDDINKPYICFLTSHNEEIQNAFKVKAFRFLFKDNFEKDICECINAFCEEKYSSTYHVVERDGIEVNILQKDIVFIKAIKNGTEVWLSTDVYTTKKSLDSWMKELDDNLFMRSHKTSIVNISHIDYVEEYITMNTGDKVEVSRRNRSELKRRFLQYIYESAR